MLYLMSKERDDLKFFLIYLAIISLVSCFVTILDKHRAKRGGRRVPERTLFLLSLAGGSAAMYLTMLTIRHKTRHKRFMIGIPLIMILQCGALILATQKIN